MNIIDRFKNQRVSQLLHFRNRPEGLDQHRVEKCFRLRQPFALGVTLKKKPDQDRAHYGSLQTCGSVWACPVCASIISERRRDMLQAAINIWRSFCPQNTVIMITYTTPHYIFQSLEEVLKIQDEAIRIMKNQPQRGLYKVHRTIMEEMNSIGTYTGREMTFGKNGWHPHRHEVNFCLLANEDQLKQWREELTEAFAIAFQKAGGKINNMEAFKLRAVSLDQITDDDGYRRISSYVTSVEGERWTLAQEATKGFIKTAKNGNITPFGMLEAIRLQDENSGLYGAKFIEYTKTMHGKKQFFPSPGLSKILLVQWKTDQELIEESKAGQYYANIFDHEWSFILEQNIRGEILALTENKNEFEFLDSFEKYLANVLAEIQGKTGTHGP